MVERSLSMREVRGSIPRISITSFFIFFLVLIEILFFFIYIFLSLEIIYIYTFTYSFFFKSYLHMFLESLINKIKTNMKLCMNNLSILNIFPIYFLHFLFKFPYNVNFKKKKKKLYFHLSSYKKINRHQVID